MERGRAWLTAGWDGAPLCSRQRSGFPGGGHTPTRPECGRQPLDLANDLVHGWAVAHQPLLGSLGPLSRKDLRTHPYRSLPTLHAILWGTFTDIFRLPPRRQSGSSAPEVSAVDAGVSSRQK